MPIECSMPMRVMTQNKFHAVDKHVMGIAFGIHNEFGRLLDERLYQEQLAQQCRDAGLAAVREAVVQVTHGEFLKEYFLDLLVADGVIYELKTAERFTGAHEKQLIHYLLLTGQRHGKLINFRTASVESRFISTRLSDQDRQDVAIDVHCWMPDGDAAARLPDIVSTLIADWGAFLDVELYQDAILHFLGGARTLERPVQILSNGRSIGRQKLPLIDRNAAVHISPVSRHLQTYEKHLRRFLQHTDLTAIHWINFDKRHIVLKTLTHPE